MWRIAVRTLLGLTMAVAAAACGVAPTPSSSPSTQRASPSPIFTAASAIAFFDAAHGLLAGNSGSDAGPTSGTIWRTADGGTTWTAAAVVPRAPFTSLAVAGTDEARAGVDCVSATSPCNPGVWASTDGGTTWQRVSTTRVMSLTFADPTHGWAALPGGPAVGDPAGGLLSTFDGGRTWTEHPNPCASGIGWPAAVTFPDALHGWVGCTSSGASTNAKGVMATVDGGRTWTVRSAARIPGEGPSVGTISFSDALAGLAMRPAGTGIWWGIRGVTERTQDGGVTWADSPPGEFDVRTPGAGWLRDDQDWLMVLWDGDLGRQALVESRDGGQTWTTVSLLPRS